MRIRVEGQHDVKSADEQKSSVRKLLKALEPVFPEGVRDLLAKGATSPDEEGGTKSRFPVVEAARAQASADYRRLIAQMLDEVAAAVDEAGRGET